MLLGTTPHLWSTTKGEHNLTFTMDGFHEITQGVPINNEGQEITVRLKRIAPEPSAVPAPQQQAPPSPLNDIKVER